MSKDYGEDIIAWAAHIGWIAEKLGDIDEINKASTANPAYEIVMMVAEQALPFYKAASPVDTGLLRDSHIIGEDRGIGFSHSGVMAWAEISIDPNTEENIKYGGFPRDYGPEYHQDKRAWFAEAEPMAKYLFDQIADNQFSIWVHTVSW